MLNHVTEWDAVATAINDRMRELVIDQAELVRRSGVSDPNVRALMTGQPRSGAPRQKTLDKVCLALGWQPGSIDDIRQGRKPRLAAPLVTTVEELSPSQLARVEAVSETMKALDRRVENLEKALAAVEARLDSTDGRSLPGGT